MKVSIITFADLGARNNLKTTDIAPVIASLEKNGMISQIVCRLALRNKNPKIKPAVSMVIHYAIKVLEKIIPGFPGRNIEEEYMDRAACRMLAPADIALVHPVFCPRTVAAAKLQGTATVGIAVVAHPALTRALLDQEYRLLNITPEPSQQESALSHNRPDVAAAFDYIIAVSEFVRQSYVQAGFPAENIFVAHNDIDAPRFAAANDGGIFRVVYVAHTNTLKGLHYLFDAWKQAKLPNAELVIVGGYSFPVPRALRDQYEKTIAHDPTIIWTGFTKTPEEYYRKASVFAFPSITEGNPRVVMEAMASGIPIITTEHAPSIVDDGVNGFIVPIRDSGAIAQKLSELYHDRERCKSMGNEARKKIITKRSFGDEVVDIVRIINERVPRPSAYEK